jgi:hypothetical protein
MAARFCSSCGRPLPAGATFCPQCGAAVPGAPSPSPTGVPVAGTTYGFPPPVGYAPIMPGPPGPTPATHEADRAALGYVSAAASTALVAAVVSVVLISISNFGRLVTVTSTTSGAVLTLPSPWLWVAILGVDGALGIAEIVLIRTGFRRLVDVDRTFSTPAGLALAALVGVVLALLGAGLLIRALYDAVQCAGSGNPITTSCLFGSAFWGGIALVGVGAIIALVGYIGILIGIWRLGTRYNDSLFKVGAILLIFPYVNLVGSILILVGARGALGRLPAAVAPPSARL